MHANISESAHIAKVCTSVTLICIDGSVASVLEWGVDLPWQMHTYTYVLTILKGHEALQARDGLHHNILFRVVLNFVQGWYASVTLSMHALLLIVYLYNYISRTATWLFLAKIREGLCDI